MMGFTSSKNMIGGELGIFDVLTDFPNHDIVLKELGKNYYVNHLSIKPYPT
jgi:2-methylcitrate dehydratase PrpD